MAKLLATAGLVVATGALLVPACRHRSLAEGVPDAGQDAAAPSDARDAQPGGPDVALDARDAAPKDDALAGDATNDKAAPDAALDAHADATDAAVMVCPTGAPGTSCASDGDRCQTTGICELCQCVGGVWLCKVCSH